MQSEAASYFIQQPYFGNGYEPSWDSYPVNNSYLSNGSNLFDEVDATPSHEHFSADFIDGIFESACVGNEVSRDFGSFSNKNVDRDPHLYLHSFSSSNILSPTYHPTVQQTNYLNYPNNPAEQTPSNERCWDQDFYYTSDTDSRSDSVISPFGNFKSFDPKLSRVQGAPSSPKINVKLSSQMLPIVQETNFLNLDSPFPENSAPNLQCGKLHHNLIHGYVSSNMDSVKIESNHQRERNWPVTLPSEGDPSCPINFQSLNLSSNVSRDTIRTNQTKVSKKRTRSRRRRKADKEKCVHLWEFIRDILLEPKHCPSLMKWEDRQAGVFRFVKSDAVAIMWGRKKQNPKMTYEKLSRAMRYYYNRGILERVDGRRLVYKFGPNAFGWKVDKETSAESNFTSTSIYKSSNSVSSVPYQTTPAPYPACEKIQSRQETNPSRLLPSANVLLGGGNTCFGA